jgi:hypothetical protein
MRKLKTNPKLWLSGFIGLLLLCLLPFSVNRTDNTAQAAPQSTSLLDRFQSELTKLLQESREENQHAHDAQEDLLRRIEESVQELLTKQKQNEMQSTAVASIPAEQPVIESTMIFSEPVVETYYEPVQQPVRYYNAPRRGLFRQAARSTCVNGVCPN